MAVTFAEAGEWKTAEEYLDKIEKLNQRKTAKIVVIAMDSILLPETVEYTVNLAERMNCDVLAVDGRQVHKSGSSFLKKKEKQRDTVKDIFNSLLEKAHVRKIYCETVIAGCDIRSQVMYLLKRIRQVELILVQLQKGQNFSLNSSIPVYKVQPQGL